MQDHLVFSPFIFTFFFFQEKALRGWRYVPLLAPRILIEKRNLQLTFVHAHRLAVFTVR